MASAAFTRARHAAALLARIGAILLLIGGGAWAQPGSNASPILGRWSGTFTWDRGPDRPQQLEVEFVSQTSGPNGTQRFIGRGVYRTQQVTNFEATLDYDPRTREVRMVEGAAPDNPDWINDGVHVGTLSADMSRIDARWVSKSGDASGRLVLTRAGQGGK
jgi:hypothetical protein